MTLIGSSKFHALVHIDREMVDPTRYRAERDFRSAARPSPLVIIIIIAIASIRLV